MVVEELLKLFVAEVDAYLFERVKLEDFKARDVEDAPGIPELAPEGGAHGAREGGPLDVGQAAQGNETGVRGVLPFPARRTQDTFSRKKKPSKKKRSLDNYIQKFIQSTLSIF